MTRFIIHIGPHKTGSTYLQNHLRDNRAALVGRGIYYPREWTTPEIDWCHAELARLLQQGSFDSVERTFAHLKVAGWPTVVLSSEDLSSLGEERVQFLRDCTGPDAEIIFYARRWSELLGSHAQEHIRQGGTKLLPEYIAPMLANPFGADMVNFTLILDRFANVFGLSRLKILPYNNILQQGQNLFVHFASRILGVDLPLVVSQAPAHASISVEDIEVVRAFNVWRSRHSVENSWPMSKLVATVLKRPLPHARAAMAQSVSDIPFNGSVQPFRAIYDAIVTKYRSVIDLQSAGPDRLLFEPRHVRLRYVDPGYLLDPAAVAELVDFFSELADTGQRLPAPGQPEPPVSSVRTVSVEFSQNGNSGSYCSTGWSAPEQGWQWATGSEACMVLPRPEPPGDYVLAIKLRPFLARPHLMRQRMIIEVNGTAVASFEEDNTEPSIKSFNIPSAIVAKGPQLSMTFRTPDAARPADFGRPDTRKLSFAFHTMTIMPVDSSDTAKEPAKSVLTAAGAV